MTELGDYRRMVEKPMIAKMNAREAGLRAALLKAREKLSIYKKYHAEYVGGPEYSNLMKEIDAALTAR